MIKGQNAISGQIVGAEGTTTWPTSPFTWPNLLERGGKLSVMPRHCTTGQGHELCGNRETSKTEAIDNTSKELKGSFREYREGHMRIPQARGRERTEIKEKNPD